MTHTGIDKYLEAVKEKEAEEKYNLELFFNLNQNLLSKIDVRRKQELESKDKKKKKKKKKKKRKHDDDGDDIPSMGTSVFTLLV